MAATASPFGALSVVIPAMGSAQRAARRQAPAADPMRRGPAVTKIVSGITDHPLEPVIAPAEGETWLRMTTAQCGTAGAAQICSANLQPKPSNQVSEDTVAWMPAYQCQGIRECRQLAWLAGNEGVGEHVRTRFQTGRSSGETAAPPKGKDPHRTKKPGFFYWTNSMTVQPLDLMSRRHPLSSTGALWFVPSAPMTCRQRSPPASQ